MLVRVRINSDNQLTIEAALNSCLEAQFRLLASHTSSPATRLQRLSYYCLNSSKLACFLLWPNLISSYICSCVLRSSPSLWSLQIKLKGFHFRFGVCGLQIKDGTQKLQMDSPLSLSLSTCSSQRFQEDLLNRRQHKEEHAGIYRAYF